MERGIDTTTIQTSIKVIQMLNNIIINQRFKVFLNDKGSRWCLTSNGLPQGSILAPLFFNLYVHNVPKTACNIFQYANDIDLVT